MKIDVYLRDTRNGKTGVYHSPCDWENTPEELEHIEYMFTEGDWSCDCNLGAFLYGDDNDPDLPCHSNVIAIDKITNRETGEVLFEDLIITGVV